MWSRVARAVAGAALAMLPALAPMTSTQAAAFGLPAHSPSALNPSVLGQDVCPEPNDTFQAACYLGPDSDAQGFISTPNDVDAYRIEVLDFNTDVHIEMATMPAAYKIELADWNGDVIATSSKSGSGETIDKTVDIPGSYYIFVHSAAGGFSDARPYSIFRSLTYPGASIPQIITIADFRAGPNGPSRTDSEFATFTEGEGRFTVAMKGGGSPEQPGQAWVTNLGEVLTDFTMTIDARVVNGVDGGFRIFFRKSSQDVTDDNAYSVAVDTRDGQALLSRKFNGDYRETGWTQSEAINTGGGVNRVVIRCFADEIRININGEDIFEVTDPSIRQGRIGFGALTWSAPAIVSFDNIIITTPTEG